MKNIFVIYFFLLIAGNCLAQNSDFLIFDKEVKKTVENWKGYNNYTDSIERSQLLDSVKTLNFSLDCENLSSLPSEILECNSLQELRLENCLNIDPASVFGLFKDSEKNIVITDFADMGNEQGSDWLYIILPKIGNPLPPELFEIRNLHTLIANGESLTNVPKEICSCVNLRELYIQLNKFSEFPKGILCLDQLEILNIGYNQISEIPEEIKELKNLRRLTLYRNPGLTEEKIVTAFKGYSKPIELSSEYFDMMNDDSKLFIIFK